MDRELGILLEKMAILHPAMGTWEEAMPFSMRYPLWLTEMVVPANLGQRGVMVVLCALFDGWESR